jgi:hypothetical protein
LKLTLTPKTCPGVTSASDPWGTKVTVNISAQFTTKKKAAAEPAVVAQTDSRDMNSWELPRTRFAWYLGFDWAPFVHIWGGDAFMSRGATAISFALSTGFSPFFGKWGRVGFDLDIDYARLYGSALFVYSAATDLYTMDAHLMTFCLNLFYRTPPLRSRFELDIRVGGGITLGFGYKTSQAENKIDESLVDPNLQAKGLHHYPFVNGGLLFRILEVGHFFLGTGADFRLFFMDSGNPPFCGYIIPRLHLEWRF